MKYKTFNTLVISILGVSLGCIALFNLVVDPIGYWEMPTSERLNSSKPQQGLHDRLLKSADIVRKKPRAVLLGSSRVQVGLDPKDVSEYGYSDVYNSALSAATIYEQLMYLRHALFNNPALELVVIGLDYETFNMYDDKYRSGFKLERMERSSLYPQDILETILTKDVTEASWKTVLHNVKDNEKVSYLRDDGARTDQYQAMMTQKTRKGRTVEEAFLAPIAETRQGGHLTGENLDVFRQIVEICKKNNIKLVAYIHPYHAEVLGRYERANRWSDFECWKVELSKIYPIWDFSGFHQVATEKISNEMLYYWEASHYKKLVGKMILRRIFDQADDSNPANFGVLITDSNVREHLARLRVDRDSWNNR